jgi:hypothetical protein
LSKEKKSSGRAQSVNHEEKGEIKLNTSRFPCRIKVHVEGVEGFFYNRSPAYDNIVNHFAKATNVNLSDERGKGKETGTSDETHQQDDIGAQRTSFQTKEPKVESSSEDEKVKSSSSQEKEELPFWLTIFPIWVNCKTGALILGNENTKSIITVRFNTATGSFDAGESGPLDLFRYLFGFNINDVAISVRPNAYYKEPQLAAGARAKSASHENKVHPKKSKKGIISRFRFPTLFSSASSVKSLASDRRESISENFRNNLPGEERWQGLSRYLDKDFMNEHDEWAGVEYASSSVLADCPKIGFTFYWDSPGKVSEINCNFDDDPTTLVDHVNGSAPPEYGMDILVYGGTVSYGPWMDRQRIIFQNIFFPPIYADALPGKLLSAGNYRISSEFKLYLSIEEETTLRIPIREQSKDWRWKGRADTVSGRRRLASERQRNATKSRRRPFWRSRAPATTGPNARPFAWLDVKVAPNTTVHYTSDMIARRSGFRSTVTADVRGLEILTSVNHGLLWRSGPTSLDCDLSVPLKYNALREWRFGVQNDDLELFILRDHLFLLVDVVSDWTSGPSSDFYTFTPFRYHLNVQFRNFKLFLNSNDSNIINDPSDFDDNNFLILYGRDLKANVHIPLDELNPKRKEIPFDLVGQDFGLKLCLNSRNTVATFTGQRDVVTVDTVTLKGSHVANAHSSAQLTDRLTFYIHGSVLTIWAFGFIIHHLVNLKENYFGDHLHFKTLEEYQALSRGGEPDHGDRVKAQKSNRSTDLDVILSITVDDARAMLPTNIYKAEECVSLSLPYAGVDLRITNYYMDLQVDLSPMSLSLSDTGPLKESPRILDDRTELFIQSANISMHRAFGLPPTEPSYMSQCYVDVGDISGECSEEFIEKLFRAVYALVMTAEDDENALSLIPLVPIHDVTFLQATTQRINIWIHVGNEALSLNVGPSTIQYNDWARSKFSQRLAAHVPEVVLAIVQKTSASRRRVRPGKTVKAATQAYIRTSLSVDLLRRKLNFTEELEEQQAFLRLQDSRTNRTPFLLNTQSGLGDLHTTNEDPPAMPFPPIAEPLTINQDLSSISDLSLSSTSSEPGWEKLRRSRKDMGARNASKDSLAQSIRRMGSRSSLRRSNTEETYKSTTSRLSTIYSIPKLPFRSQKSSIAFSSPLAVPYFPLMNVELDVGDLPDFPEPSHRDNPKEFLEPRDIDLPEDAIHTSVLVNVGPGVQGFVKSEALPTVINLLALLLPKSPDDMLDYFQGSIVSNLVSRNKSLERQPESIEVRLDIQSLQLRFLNSFVDEQLGSSLAMDQFDISLSGFSLIGRHQLSSRESSDSRMALHTTFNNFAVTAIEKYPDHEKADVAFDVRINDFLFWLALADDYSGSTTFKSIVVEATSSKIEYLSDMIDRTSKLVEGISKDLSSVTTQFRNRLQYLAYYLTMASSDIADPTFLTRPSYLLRASTNHVRKHDSWKMVSRFRYIFEQISSQSRNKLIDECIQGTGILPANAQEVVINTWNQWRAWDITNAQESLSMQFIYPHQTKAVQEILVSNKRLRFSLRSENLHFLIDRGQRQSDFLAGLMAIDFDSSGPSTLSGLKLVNTPSRKTTLLVDTHTMILTINWELVALVQSLLKTFEGIGKSKKSRKSDTKAIEPEIPDSYTHIIQAVLKVGSTMIDVNTINVKATLANENMNASIIGSVGLNSSDGQLISALFHAEAAWSQFKSKSAMLLGMRADLPNLYLSREVPADDSTEKEVEWRLAGTSSHLQIDIDEEILDMLEIADHIIRDEVAEIQERFGHLLENDTARPKPKIHLQRGLPKLNLALLMEGYSVNIALLQSIAYTMSGKEGRISISPRLVQPRSLDINFDIDGHSHNLVSTFPGEEHVISSFDLPTVNGKIGIRRAKERTILNVTAIVEEIVVDAKQVYALLSTFKRPEMSKTFRTIQSDVKTIQARLEAMFPISAVASSVEELKRSTLVYNVSATLAGMKITTSAESKALKGAEANLSIGLDGVQIMAYNVLKDDENILPLPEISVKLKRIFAELNIKDADGIRPCGKLSLFALIRITRRASKGGAKRNYQMELKSIDVQAFAETASAVVNVLNELQDKIRDLDLSRERRYLQRLRQPTRRPSLILGESIQNDFTMASSGLFTSAFSISLTDIQVSWIIGNSVPAIHGHEPQDLVLSIKVIDLRSKSRSTSLLTIEDFQLQMVPVSQDKRKRSLNSALLPEMIFNVAYASSEEDRKISFQARGKGLDVQLESQFILPASLVQRSITFASKKFKEASVAWKLAPTGSGDERRNPFGDKKVSSLLVDADFAGAVVRLSGRQSSGRPTAIGISKGDDVPHGRFGQFTNDENVAAATFRTPGLAFKVEYSDTGKDSTFTSEVKINSSSNALTPSVVPLVLDISNSIKMIVEDTDNDPEKADIKMSQSQSFFSDERLLNADPEALLGSTSFNLGIRICKQEFSLSCQPIARVDAAVGVDDIYITANSIKSPDKDLFFAVAASFENLQASVQHVYSRESTFSFNMERLVLSVMNSKHLSGTAGISAVLKVYPMKTHVNARQLQDFLLFRDIWLPEEIRGVTVQPQDNDMQEYLVQKYQQVATATAFPWTATISIEKLEVDLDMGQAIGRASLIIDDLWTSSKKDSNWEQNLCFGIHRVAIESTGRTSGFVELIDFQIRTSISWPVEEVSLPQTPLIQASAAFERLRVKSAFDYQVFGIVDIEKFTFLMYNVRETEPVARDRLVAILDGDKVQASCTATSAAQAIALLQALEKLVQENEAAYSQSIKDIERYQKRQSSNRPRLDPGASFSSSTSKKDTPEQDVDAPISLHTDVVVSLREISLGAFPGSFSDNRVFIVDASNIQARFAVKMNNENLIHSGLGMTLGQLQVALTQISHQSAPKTIEEITVEEVIQTMNSTRGGIILRVPKVVARMQTWQAPLTYHIDYIFKSSFEGKVDVGWNYSRISFIRDMWNTHSQSLASRLGKPLPESAVKIRASGEKDGDKPSASFSGAESSNVTSLSITDQKGEGSDNPERITAVVHVPQSRYEYTALETPIIETPQLRDMGEATPPLEWIGLHRDRLPNVTHQIVIVGLLGIAREVEDAYERILGSSGKS